MIVKNKDTYPRDGMVDLEVLRAMIDIMVEGEELPAKPVMAEPELFLELPIMAIMEYWGRHMELPRYQLFSWVPMAVKVALEQMGVEHLLPTV